MKLTPLVSDTHMYRDCLLLVLTSRKRQSVMLSTGVHWIFYSDGSAYRLDKPGSDRHSKVPIIRRIEMLSNIICLNDMQVTELLTQE